MKEMYKEKTAQGYMVQALVKVDHTDNGKPLYAMVAYKGDALGFPEYVVTGSYDATDGTWWHGTYIKGYGKALEVLKEKIYVK